MTWDTERKVIGRRPFQYIEMDMDYCTQSYGVSPCLAAGSYSTDTFTGPDGTLLANHNEIGSYRYVNVPSSNSPEIISNALYTDYTDGRAWETVLDIDTSNNDHEIY